jgi:peptidoglycan/xylan/chitin deacetylase (PgdA/CDA1 family)
MRSVAWLARGSRTPARGLRLLFYHRVSDDEDELSVPVRRFREQMDFLAAEGYDVVDVTEIGALLAAGRVPGHTVGLSFDDGCSDVAENALPVLSRHGFRATVFLATGVTDGRARFAWYARQPALLSWDEVIVLDGGGTLAFEAHSVTHPNLPALDDDEAMYEIAQARVELAGRLGRPVTAFSYPTGLYGEREMRLAEAAGYDVAVSCEPGVNLPGTNRFALRRRQIDRRDGLLDFRAKLEGAHDTPLPMRTAYRRIRYGTGRGSRLAR